MVVACISLTLLLAHIMRLQSDTRRLENHAARVLETAVNTAAESIDTLRHSLGLHTTPCSAEDLKELRVLAFRSTDIRDVGRIDGDQVLCTGAWGALPAPLKLPPPTRVANSHRFWSEGPSIIDPRISTDMLAAGGVMLFVAPSWFDNVAHLDSRVQAIVTTHDRAEVLRATGADLDQYRDDHRTAPYDLHTERVVDICSDTYNLCVVALNRSAGIASLMPHAIVGLCLLGGLAGVGLNSLLGYSRRRRATLESQLTRALRGDGLHMEYQPLRRVSDQRLVGFEALARWTTEDGDRVTPDVFVRMAERIGLGRDLARQVVRKTFAELAPRLAGEAPLYVGINLTADDLIDRHFLTYLDTQASKHGVETHHVVVEITERSTATRDDLIRSIRQLRARGYQIYIDDFGTGYSSLDYLADLPLDAVKIDKLFTQAVGSDSVLAPIFEPICTMARALNLGIVAEGIETEEQLRHVVALAPHAVGQGWLLGRPMPVDRLPTT